MKSRLAGFPLLCCLACLIHQPPAAASESRLESIPESPESLIPDAFRVPLPDPEAARRPLAAGASGWVVPDSSLPLVQVIVVLPAGERRDDPGRRGLAGLTAAMLRRGGAGEREADALDLAADRLGPTLESLATEARALVVLEAGAWNLEAGLDLLFDVLARPRFDSGRLALYREGLAQGLEDQAADPAVVASRAWERLVATPGETLSAPLEPLGIRSLGRQDLVRFHRRHWRPERAVVAVAGAVEPERIVASLDRRLEEWAEVAGPAQSSEPPQAEAPGEDGKTAPAPGLRIVDTAAGNAVVAVGHRLRPASDLSRKERYAAVILEELLAGQGGVNRLVGRLRTGEGLVYGIDSELRLEEGAAGRWLSLFPCDPARVGPALVALRQALERLRSEPISSDELAAARAAILGRLRSRFDTPEGVAGTWAEDELVGRDHAFWLGLADGLAAVTPAQVRAIARKLLHPEDAIMVVAGPRALVEKSLEKARLPASWKADPGR